MEMKLLKKSFVITFLIIFKICSYSQIDSVHFLNKQKKWRKPFVISTLGTAYAGSLIGLNQLWYANYPKSSFQLFDDSREWLGMDKIGHFTTNYYIAYYGYDIFRWSGFNRKTSIWTAAIMGVTYQTTIEVLDGLSAQWGFSMMDQAMNIGGGALFVTQQLVWDEQRIMPKISYAPTSYPKLRPEVLGSNALESILKDYNGQTYWLSVNIWSFLKNREQRKFPRWLNLAVGYGADGLVGGSANPVPYQNIRRTHQFYLSLDIDLTKIETKSKFLKTLFKGIQLIKIPAPAFEFTTDPSKPVNFHWFMF